MRENIALFFHPLDFHEVLIACAEIAVIVLKNFVKIRFFVFYFQVFVGEFILVDDCVTERDIAMLSRGKKFLPYG